MASSTVNSPELTQEQVQRMLIQPLEKASVFLAAGPRIFDCDGNVVRIPKFTSMGEPSWHGENELINEVDPDFGEVTLLDNMASVKSLTRFSNELARQSVIALDAALKDKMVRDVAAKLDNAFIAGTGTPTASGKATPVGLLNYTGVQSMLAVGTPSIDDLHDAVGMALGAEVDPLKLRWFTSSRDLVTLRKLKESTSGKYLLQPDPTLETAYRLLGHPVTITNRIPTNGGVGTNASTIALADFSTIAVARDVNPAVKILDQTFGDYDQMAIRVVARMDAKPLLPQAIVLLKGVTP